MRRASLLLGIAALVLGGFAVYSILGTGGSDQESGAERVPSSVQMQGDETGTQKDSDRQREVHSRSGGTWLKKRETPHSPSIRHSVARRNALHGEGESERASKQVHASRRASAPPAGNSADLQVSPSGGGSSPKHPQNSSAVNAAPAPEEVPSDSERSENSSGVSG